MRPTVAEPPSHAKRPDRSRRPLPRILVVEDNELERQLIRHRLRPDRVELLEAADGASGLELARSALPDLILLDLDLPDLSRLRGASDQLKEDPSTRSIPVIFLSGLRLDRGEGPGARPRARSTSSPSRSTRPSCGRGSGWLHPAEVPAGPAGEAGPPRRPDRPGQSPAPCAMRLDAEWSACRRRSTPLSLLIVDLDHFKRINDRFGHAAGDEALRRVAEALRVVARASDLVARFGGEEFVLLAPDCDLIGGLAWPSGPASRSRALRLVFEGDAAPADGQRRASPRRRPSIAGRPRARGPLRPRRPRPVRGQVLRPQRRLGLGPHTRAAGPLAASGGPAGVNGVSEEGRVRRAEGTEQKLAAAPGRPIPTFCRCTLPRHSLAARPPPRSIDRQDHLARQAARPVQRVLLEEPLGLRRIRQGEGPADLRPELALGDPAGLISAGAGGPARRARR